MRNSVQSLPGRGNSKSKSPESGACLVCFSEQQGGPCDYSVGTEGTVVGFEAREVRGAILCVVL